jgi:hypothetical protein
VVSNYPPLFPLVQAAFVWLFGPAFWYGRLISLLSAAAVTLLVGLTLHALTRDRLAAVAGGPDLPGHALRRAVVVARAGGPAGAGALVGGLFVLARWPHKRWSVVAAGLLLVAAVYTRQTYALAAPLAAFVWLLVPGPEAAGAGACRGRGGSRLILFGILNVLTGGGFFSTR